MAEKKSFKERFLSFLDRGVESSKNAFHKAGSKINDFSDKSVLRIDIARLNSKLEKLYEELGKLSFEKRELSKKSASDVKEFENFYTQIEEILKEIESKKNSISEIKEKKDNPAEGSIFESEVSEVKEDFSSSQATIVAEAPLEEAVTPSEKTPSVKKTQIAKKTAASKKTSSSASASKAKTASKKPAAEKKSSAKSASSAKKTTAASKKPALEKKTSAAKSSSSKTAAAKKSASSVSKTSSSKAAAKKTSSSKKS